MMKYKGYFGSVFACSMNEDRISMKKDASSDKEVKYFDEEDGIMHGEVIGLKDVITFQGKTVKELKEAFHESVDDYLAWCKERGEKPEKTYSGNIRLRMNPDLHAHLALEAARKNMSLNDLINEKLRK